MPKCQMVPGKEAERPGRWGISFHNQLECCTILYRLHFGASITVVVVHRSVGWGKWVSCPFFCKPPNETNFKWCFMKDISLEHLIMYYSSLYIHWYLPIFAWSNVYLLSHSLLWTNLIVGDLKLGPSESFLIIGAAEFYFLAKEYHRYELLVLLCFNGDFL